MDDGGFKHDGEGHGSCTGYGCDCDEKRYGSHSGGGGNGNSGCAFLIWLIIASIVGGINQTLGALIIIIVGIYYLFFR
jgi:hypothetical protein